MRRGGSRESGVSLAQFVNAGEFTDSFSAIAALHVATSSRPNTICSREQMKYAHESAIRLRFVPALIEVLTIAPYDCIYRSIIFKLIKDEPQSKIRLDSLPQPSRVRHVFDRESLYVVENKGRISGSERFVSDSFRLWPVSWVRQPTSEKSDDLQIINHKIA